MYTVSNTIWLQIIVLLSDLSGYICNWRKQERHSRQNYKKNLVIKIKLKLRIIFFAPIYRINNPVRFICFHINSGMAPMFVNIRTHFTLHFVKIRNAVIFSYILTNWKVFPYSPIPAKHMKLQKNFLMMFLDLCTLGKPCIPVLDIASVTNTAKLLVLPSFSAVISL